jgi:hypothetical protein
MEHRRERYCKWQRSLAESDSDRTPCSVSDVVESSPVREM